MFKRAKNLIIIVFVLMAILLVADFILAAGPDLGMEYGEATGLGETDPRQIAANIIRIVLAFLGVVAVILIIYGGFVWMTAAGNEERIKLAKKVLASAIIGLIIILSAFAIATFLLNRILGATGPPGPPPGPPTPPIPPIPEVYCDGNTLTPECDADSNICVQQLGPDYYCNQTSCRCRRGGGDGDPCDSDTGTPECEIDDGLCASDYYCQSSSCRCRKRSILFEACNATTTVGVCEPLPQKCSTDLTCDITDCFCKDFPIIKWISPTGGFCDDNPDMSCLVDADCGTTCNIDTPNAAVGNIITISGRFFGTTTGDVMFWDGNDFVIPGTSPAALNLNCDSNWQDDQIIIVVPAGAQTGPLRVIRARDSLSDDTNNNQGPPVPDLLINNIDKPGLCKIDPAEGRLDDNIDYHGINFSVTGGDVRFGIYASYIAGNNSNFLNDTTAQTEVPSIERGKTSSFIMGDAGKFSNYLNFVKLLEIVRGPYIISFEPQAGASGQYVTIYGFGFGPSQRGSRVYFGSEATGFEADYDFPDVCADSVWNDDQIIVKVPEGIVDANYVITLALETGTIDTSSISPRTFMASSSLSLTPCLCKISPIMGQAGIPISLWGEYFDERDGNSRVRFYSGNDMLGAGIDFWDLDPESQSAVEVYKIETTVHPGAVTGPVRVVRSSPEQIGNGLNFFLGNCLEATDPDQACGADICCGADTYRAGRCAANINDCYVDIPSSVYEWDFSTDPGIVIPEDPFTSCAEKSKILGTCEPEICPNSAGQCSFYSGGEAEIVDDCSYTCQLNECVGNSCTYNASFDRCVTPDICSLPIIVQDVHGVDTDAYCALYQGVPHRVIYDPGTSCPTGWNMVRLAGEQSDSCVDPNSNLSCTLCSSTLYCLDDNNGDDQGICAAPPDICPPGAVCESDDKCKKLGEEICECCCRLAVGDEDCCIPLRCESDCGSDRNIDTDIYGYCSGCRVDSNNDGDISPAERDLSDEACNCEDSSGRYCDVWAGEDNDNDGYPDGICRDCGSLDETECSAHPVACCVDAMKNKKCRGGTGNSGMVGGDSLAYCEYHQCTSDNIACDTGNNPVATVLQGTKYFDTDLRCQTECSPPPVLGLSCAGRATNTCDTAACSYPLDCLNEDNIPIGFPDNCGICCCDPNLATDPCPDLNPADYPDLVCQPDKEPCTSDYRGLCCGCTANNDCGNIDLVGCGNDACCRARPWASSTMPADGEDEICTNAEIRVTFGQRMSADSFSGNIIVVGEYGDVCPEGTVYLARAGAGWEDKNIIVRTFYKVINFLREPLRRALGKKAIASPPPVATMNYCAIAGSVDNEHLGTRGTILRFMPLELLATSTKYFVIIRGDVGLNNQTGVLSFWNIGMNELFSLVDNTSAFNGITYANSYIWSFTTLPDQNGGGGVCEIDHVTVSPASYLFQTVINDLNENDLDSANISFDTARDRDKKFTAYAISSKGQILASVPGYSWEWLWSVEDPSVAGINLAPFATSAESQLLEADPNDQGVTDKATKLFAEVNLTQSTYSNVGDGEMGEADIRIFVCENPWPPIMPNGTWYPWRDTDLNCIPGTGTCLDTNYVLYYCRDHGEFGTVDDLPSILSSAVTRGSGNELLKESYFFREEMPEITDVNLQFVAVSEGEAAEFYWDEILDPQGVDIVTMYKLYYDTDSGIPYSDYITVDAARAPYAVGTWFRLEGLENNVTYYFAVTAQYETGGESDYSNEAIVEVDDTLAPASPQGVQAVITNATTTIEVSWQANTDDTVGYRLYYGHAPGVYGSRIPLGDDEELILNTTNSFDIISEQTAYYIAVTAVDEEGNESAKSQEVVVTINQQDN